ncbi:MAG: cation diffusion facilitator family transporter [Pirellulaceae bacterium]
MAHQHDHGPASFQRAFLIGIVLNVTFVVVETIFGFLAGSMALLADAGHNLSDVLSLMVAWGANYLASLPPSQRRTYGLRRSTILGSLLNAVVLLLAIGAIAWESIKRFNDPAPVAEMEVIIVAAIGVVINTLSALLFLSGRKSDLNVKGAFLHMAADAGVSVGVVVAGIAIMQTGFQWIDPLTSLVIVLVIAVSSWGLLRDSTNLALDAVPEGIDPGKVEAYLQELPGVTEVHDLHIWGMSTTEAALTAHLQIPEYRGDDALLAKISQELHDKFDIEHATIQIERGDIDSPCRLASPDVV